jgi:signal transduction histidine kinase
MYHPDPAVVHTYYYDLKVINQDYATVNQTLVLVFSDQSPQIALERERALNEYITTMFASINHEWRTPLNAILQCILLLLA